MHMYVLECIAAVGSRISVSTFLFKIFTALTLGKTWFLLTLFWLVHDSLTEFKERVFFLSLMLMECCVEYAYHMVGPHSQTLQPKKVFILFTFILLEVFYIPDYSEISYIRFFHRLLVNSLSLGM